MAGLRRWVRREAGADEGFTLVEVIVATLIFVLVSTATLTILIASIRAVGENRDRVFAASVARQQVEELRALGSTTAKTTVDTTPTVTVTTPDARKQFTVTRSAAWVPSGTTSACETTVNPKEALLSVRVDVSGGSLGAPQRVETLIHTVNRLAATLGSISVRVTDALGQPIAGAMVTGTINGGAFAELTSAAGCVFVPALAAGTWAISVAKAGHTPNPFTTSAVVTGGTNTKPPTVVLTRVL